MLLEDKLWIQIAVLFERSRNERSSCCNVSLEDDRCKWTEIELPVARYWQYKCSSSVFHTDTSVKKQIRQQRMFILKTKQQITFIY